MIVGDDKYSLTEDSWVPDMPQPEISLYSVLMPIGEL